MIENLAGPWWVFISVGLGAGILSGALGVGSGIVVVPILVLLIHLPQKAAQGTALALMVPMALLGTVQYWRHGDLHVCPMVLLLLITGSLVGVMIGTGIVHRIPGDLLRKIFAVFILMVGVRMLLTSEHPRLSEETNKAEHRTSNYESTNP